jgi:hypothetical protein
MTRAKSSSAPLGQGITSTITAATATFGAVTSAAGTVSGLLSGGGGSLGDKLLSGTGLSAGAEAIGDVMDAVSMFGGSDASDNDWRVRLSLPRWQSFQNSPVLKPLKDAGGLIFPYTPQIQIQSSARYTAAQPVHTNYQFQAYKSSDPGQIQITAPMNVEDPTQALYWIACVHYLRSLSKMFTGSDPKAGNPPPIVFLNGYGNYVFKNIPVAITSFSTTLPNDCDYIATDVVGSAAGAVAGIADSVGSLSDSIGGTFGDAFGGAVGDIAGAVGSAAGFVGNVASLAGTFGLGGTTSGGQAYVPTKSQFSVTLQPMYSRQSARTFSLDRFVQGGYLNNPFGYL